jgi:hypothetical protein
MMHDSSTAVVVVGNPARPTHHLDRGFFNHSFLCAPAFTKKGVSNHDWKKGMMGHQ